MTDEIDRKLRMLTAEKLTIDGMSIRVGRSRTEVCQRLARMGLPIPSLSSLRTKGTHTPGKPLRFTMVEFFALYRDESLTVHEIATKLGISEKTVYGIAKRVGLPTRRPKKPKDDIEVSEEEEQQSKLSLRLSPFVEREAQKIRARWTEAERYTRRAHKVSPIFYGMQYAP